MKKEEVFSVQVYDFSLESNFSLGIADRSSKMLQLFQNGAILVQKNKQVIFYDFESHKKEQLYAHKVSVVWLCCDKNFIASMDKMLNLKVFNFKSRSFLANNIYFRDIQDFPQAAKDYQFFEMEYPYFASINDHFLSFTTDYGLFSLDINIFMD